MPNCWLIFFLLLVVDLSWSKWDICFSKLSLCRGSGWFGWSFWLWGWYLYSGKKILEQFMEEIADILPKRLMFSVEVSIWFIWFLMRWIIGVSNQIYKKILGCVQLRIFLVHTVIIFVDKTSIDYSYLVCAVF